MFSGCGDKAPSTAHSVTPSQVHLLAAPHLRGRVMATLRRRGSVTNPSEPLSFRRTALNTMTSASRPWYPSTEDTVTWRRNIRQPFCSTAHYIVKRHLLISAPELRSSCAPSHGRCILRMHRMCMECCMPFCCSRWQA